MLRNLMIMNLYILAEQHLSCSLVLALPIPGVSYRINETTDGNINSSYIIDRVNSTLQISDNMSIKIMSEYIDCVKVFCENFAYIQCVDFL